MDFSKIHNDAAGRLFGKAVMLSFLLHLAVGWWLYGNMTTTPVAVPQVIPVELRWLSPPVTAVAKQEKSLLRPARQRKAPLAATVPSQTSPIKLQAVPMSSTTISQKSLPTSSASVSLEHDSIKKPASVPVAVSKPDPVIEGPAVERRTSIKKPDRSAAIEAGYCSLVRARLERNKEYPAMARRGRIEGVVIVKFVIEYDGAVSFVKVLKSSGHTLLDKSALRTVHNSAPFPVPPDSLKNGAAGFSLPLVFKMDL